MESKRYFLGCTVPGCLHRKIEAPPVLEPKDLSLLERIDVKYDNPFLLNLCMNHYFEFLRWAFYSVTHADICISKTKDL